MSAPGFGRLFTSVALALGATLLTTTTVFAAPGGPPDPADSRATAHAGNVVTCAGVGLPGTTIDLNTTANQVDVTVTDADLPAGAVILAVVVKGGPAYNVYQGLSAWTDLHSPLTPGGPVPTISHAFACVRKPPPGTPAPTPKPTPPPHPTKPGTPSGSGAPSPSGLPSTTNGDGSPQGATTTTAVGAAAAPSNGGTGTGTAELPNTGLSDGWLIWVGGALLLAGGGALGITRRVRRRS